MADASVGALPPAPSVPRETRAGGPTVDTGSAHQKRLRPVRSEDGARARARARLAGYRRHRPPYAHRGPQGALAGVRGAVDPPWIPHRRACWTDQDVDRPGPHRIRGSGPRLGANGHGPAPHWEGALYPTGPPAPGPCLAGTLAPSWTTLRQRTSTLVRRPPPRSASPDPAARKRPVRSGGSRRRGRRWARKLRSIRRSARRGVRPSSMEQSGEEGEDGCGRGEPAGSTTKLQGSRCSCRDSRDRGRLDRL